ncbi:MAG: serine/threonine protein kinase [Myxococcales bacterium]|nr:serine/threonine protein kinase [Myxococcales bacterium]
MPRLIDQRYVLGPVLGAGGMATVHLAKRVGPHGWSRLYAIKSLHGHLGNDPHLRAMFVDEAHLAARIKHPNVVSVLDVATEDGELFLVMEYVHGVSLAELTHRTKLRRGRVPQPIVFAVARDLLEGLHAAHEATTESGEPLGVVHRDVSPHNVIVGADGIARVLDFGIAWAKKRSEQTESGQIKGKLTYMAPEQLVGGKVDRRADVYSASLVVWEMLAGEKPFDRDDLADLVFRKTRREVERPSNTRLSIADAVDAVVVRGFARDPDHRFATARQMADAIAEYGRPATPGEVAAWVAETCPERLASLTASAQALTGSAPEAEEETRPRAAARAAAITTPSAASLVVSLPDAAPAEPPAEEAPPASGPAPTRHASGTRRIGEPIWRALRALFGGSVLGGALVVAALASQGAGRGATTRAIAVRTLAARGPFAPAEAATAPRAVRGYSNVVTPKAGATSAKEPTGTRGSPAKKRP